MATIIFQRTTYARLVECRLISQLEEELKHMYEYDVQDQLFPTMTDSESSIYQAIMVLSDGLPIACGTFRAIDHAYSTPLDTLFDIRKDSTIWSCAEVNRVFVAPSHRGKDKGSIATKLIAALEEWGAEQGYDYFVLKTDNRQLAGVRLYERAGWKHIPLYGEAYQKGSTISMARYLR